MSLRLIAAHSLIISTMVTVSTTALADTLDINLRDSSAQFQYKSSLGRDPLGKTEFHMGMLYADKNNILADFGLLVKDELGGNAPGFSVGIGIKGVVAKVSGNSSSAKSASAMALGALVRYSPPASRRLGIVGEAYLSPNIVTFGDADRYTETGLKLDYEVIPQAVAYIGYRKIKLGLTNPPDEILDEGVNIGVKITF
jgi:YfaZ precursor